MDKEYMVFVPFITSHKWDQPYLLFNLIAGGFYLQLRRFQRVNLLTISWILNRIEIIREMHAPVIEVISLFL